MLRPGNAGSFTASDHLLVLEAAFAQIPVTHRDDVLVTIDGAGASHEVIDYLSGLNTARTHRRRGRRVEYSIGWPVDGRTRGAIQSLRERDWGPSLAADGSVEAHAQVVDLTSMLRTGVTVATSSPTGPLTYASWAAGRLGRPASPSSMVAT